NGDIVYFDGFISRKGNGEINYSNIYFSDSKVVNEQFNFNALSISKTKATVKSDEFKKGIKVMFNNINTVEQYRLGKINKKAFENKIKISKKAFEKLPKNELDYLKRLNGYLQLDYL